MSATGLSFRSATPTAWISRPRSFDVVIAHTLISHVTEPAMVLNEMARVVRPGGTVVIFDGDYASLTYGFPDHGFGHQMDVALASATFNNPRIMRDLPRLLPEFGLKLTAAWGDAVVEIGHGSYFKSFVETYAPYVKRAGCCRHRRWMSGSRSSCRRWKMERFSRHAITTRIWPAAHDALHAAPVADAYAAP